VQQRNRSSLLSLESTRVRARAFFLGARAEVREFEQAEAVALSPLTVRAGERGYAFIFRFGVVVLVDVTAEEETKFLQTILPFVSGPFKEPETEETEITIDADHTERVDANGILKLNIASVERLQVVSNVLAKSTVLAHYEGRVASVFDRIEGLAEDLRRGIHPARGRELLGEIGDVLLIQTQTVGRVEVTEKPEITWDQPELDRLYERLAAEYELRDRDLALSRKLELVSRTAETYLNLMNSRQNIRLEWYIVILILVEIALAFYQFFVTR
jgi:required for meiotic nuclear division protein 1